MPQMLDALVVGAGPTGLTMAGELARRGLAVRLIDKALEPPPDHSRALAVQSRTMEVFEQMGIVEDERARGMPVTALNVLLSSGKRARLPFLGAPSVPTAFPGVFVVQQFDTEAVLAARLSPLGVALERGVELTSYAQDGDGVTASLRLQDGSQEEVRAAWLLGCDGARSPTRKGAGIAFEGDTYDDQCLLGDLVIDWELPDGELYICPTKKGIVAAFPVPGEHRYRVILILPEARRDAPPTLSLEEFEGTARAMLPVPFRVKKAIVLSRYRLHHRVAARLRSGRVFLCGDAAHIHSPVGGQGMNTGIQDAYNLAWKLAAVHRGRMPAWVLDTYAAERLPVARFLVSFTDRFFGLMAGHGVQGRLIRALGPRVAALAFGSPTLQSRMAKVVSQLRIRYRNSPLSVQIGDAPQSGPRAGDRALDGELRDGSGAPVRVFDLLRGLTYTLLLFAGPGAAASSIEQARALSRRLGGPDVRAVVIGVPSSAKGDKGDEYADPEGRVHATYGASSSAAVLVRPDGYIGLRCDPSREDALARELALLLPGAPEAR